MEHGQHPNLKMDIDDECLVEMAAFGFTRHVIIHSKEYDRNTAGCNL